MIGHVWHKDDPCQLQPHVELFPGDIAEEPFERQNVQLGIEESEGET